MHGKNQRWPGPRRSFSFVLVTALAVSLSLSSGLQARANPYASWEQLAGVPGPVMRIFTPTSGALFAQTDRGLFRSDDGGDSWRPVALPDGVLATTGSIVVEPRDHTTLYVVSAEGLLRTIDDGASWSVIRPRDADFSSILAVAVSPADRDLLYLVESNGSTRTIRFVRSLDRGATWSVFEQDGHEHLWCDWKIGMLLPHPTDPNRLFRSAACPHSGGPSAPLQQSQDRGDTWTILVDSGTVAPETVQNPLVVRTPVPTPVTTGRFAEPVPKPGQVSGFPDQLVGGQGAVPTRFYLGIWKDSRGGGSSLLRTDDDGRTWHLLLDYFGGGGMTPQDDPRPDVTIGGLAYDPAAPDRVYVGFNEQVKGQASTTTVRASADAGATWTDLGVGIHGRVRALALGIDGRNLYAATHLGLFRMRLT